MLPKGTSNIANKGCKFTKKERSDLLVAPREPVSIKQTIQDKLKTILNGTGDEDLVLVISEKMIFGKALVYSQEIEERILKYNFSFL